MSSLAVLSLSLFLSLSHTRTHTHTHTHTLAILAPSVLSRCAGMCCGGRPEPTCCCGQGLSLSHTHIHSHGGTCVALSHTHTLAAAARLSGIYRAHTLFVSRFLPLSYSVSDSRSHTHTLSLSHELCLPHTHELSSVSLCSLSLRGYVMRGAPRAHVLLRPAYPVHIVARLSGEWGGTCVALSLSHTSCPLFLSLSLSHTHTFSLSDSLSRSLTHTH